MNRLFSALALLAAATPTVGAQASVAHEPTNDSFDLGQELSEWRSAHGPSWRATESARTGRVEFLFGGSGQAPFVPESAVEFERLARIAISDSAGLHGVADETLVFDRTLHLPLARIGTTDKVTVRYRQVVRGVPVVDGWLNVLFDDQGSLLSVQTTAVPGIENIETRPGMHVMQASALAAKAFRDETGMEPTHLHTPELTIDLVEEGETHTAYLVWRAAVQWIESGFEPMGWDYTLDAHTGELLKSAKNIHHFDVTGTVSTWATPGSSADSASNPEVILPLNRVTLTSNQGSATSDVDGNFTFSGVNSVTGVQVRYNGPYVNVNNDAGTDYVLNAGTLSGSGNSIVLNPTQGNLITAQANAHRGVTFFRDWVRGVNASDNTMDFLATANTNITDTCNAFYNGNSTNYFQAGSGCANTSFSAIVAHEQGHWANSRYGTGNGGDGMGEGNADVFAMYQYNDPSVGRGFFTSGAAVRTGVNLRQYCGDGNGGCYGQVHTDGEVWMGAAWKIRLELESALGLGLGRDTADSLFMGWLNAYNQTTINSIIETQWLTLDDDNGNIGDGTPNFEPVDAGFRIQGFPGIELDYFTLDNVTRLADTADTAGPYVVSANVQALINPPLASVDLYWRVVGAGGFVATPMTLGGGSHNGQIPGPADNAIVEYYVSATDSSGLTATFPALGGSQPLVFGVGAITPVLADNFQADLGWIVGNDPSLTSGAWERVDPQGTTSGGSQAQPENDFSSSGSLCYVTGGSAGGSVGAFDVDEGPTRLFTPAFDLGGQNAIVSLAYWFFNDDGDDNLLIAISNDGGSTYTNVRTIEASTNGWVEDSFVVSRYVAPTSTMSIRIRAKDSPNNSITEALVDDVYIRAVADSTCPDPVTFCPASVNSSGSAGALGWSGSTGVGANNLVFSTTGMPTSTNGVMIYSPDQVSTPLGDGTLCVGSASLGFVLRFGSFTSDFLGTTVIPFDNTSPPDPAGQVSAGETWYFQTWFRDPGAGGAGFTFSDALCVTFCP